MDYFKDYLLKRPMILTALIFSLCALLGFYFPKILYLVLVIFLIALVVFIIKKNQKAAMIFALSLVMIISVILTNLNIASLSKIDNTTQKTTFTIYKSLKGNNTFYSAYAEINSSKALKKGERFLLYYTGAKLEDGDIAQAIVDFTKLGDDRSSYYSERVYLSGRAENIELINNSSDSVLNFSLKINKYIKNVLFKNLSESSASTLCALIFGDKGYFSDEYYSNVKAAGVAHMMAVSGLHLSVFVAIFTFLFKRFARNIYVEAFIILGVTILLALICGFTKSILRAGLTYFIMAFGMLIGKRGNPENTLGAAVSLILLISPYAIFSVGFRLSVFSTFGILSFAIPSLEFLDKKFAGKTLIKSVLSVLIVSFFATIMTIPTMIHIFGTVSVFSLLTNLLLGFAVNLVLWLSVIALLLNLAIPVFAKLIFMFSEWIIEYINLIINFFGSLEFAMIEFPQGFVLPSAILILVIFMCLLACKKQSDMIKLKEMTERK